MDNRSASVLDHVELLWSKGFQLAVINSRQDSIAVDFDIHDFPSEVSQHLMPRIRYYFFIASNDITLELSEARRKGLGFLARE